MSTAFVYIPSVLGSPGGSLKFFFFFSSFAYYSGLHIKIINCFRILNYIHYFRCIIGLSRRVNVFNVVESGFSLKEEWEKKKEE